MSAEMTLPEEWKTLKLEDLFVHIIGGDWGKDPETEDENFVHVLCIRGTEFRSWNKERGASAVLRKIKQSSLSSRKLEIGDILIEISGGGPDQPVGRTVVIDDRALKQHKSKSIVCTNFIRLARPIAHVNPFYLNYYLTAFYMSGEVINYQGGSNNLRNLKFKEYSQITVSLPPLAEQHQIAQRLDELLAQVDTIKARLDAIPAILKRFRQSVLSAAVSGKLTEEWRGNSALIDWKEYSLSQLINKPSYGSSAKSNKEGKIPVLRMGNIQNGKIDWSDLVYSSNDNEIEKYKLEKNDVLFNRTNSPELVGKTAIYKGEQKAIYAGYLIKIRCSAHLNPDFLNFTLNSPQAKDYCMSVKTDGVSQSNINAQKIGAYIINCPPTEEQEEIVRRVDQFFTFADQIEQRVNDAKARVDKLTQSILAKAFRGELTADWRAEHPELISGENSAEALLAKIQAAKAALEGKKKKGKAA